MGVRYADDMERIILKLHSVTVMLQDGNASVAQGIGHGAFIIDVVVISKDCEKAERRLNTREDFSDRPWRYTPAAQLADFTALAELPTRRWKRRR